MVANIWRWIIISKEHLINDEIRAKEVRLVGAEGEQIGITPIREALQMAIDLNLDLVNVAPTANKSRRAKLVSLGIDPLHCPNRVN